MERIAKALESRLIVALLTCCSDFTVRAIRKEQEGARNSDDLSSPSNTHPEEPNPETQRGRIFEAIKEAGDQLRTSLS